ncbi:putative transposase, partial [Escherichia coli 99.0672]
MLPSETMIWQPEFTDKTLSRKTGAVQGAFHVNPDDQQKLPECRKPEGICRNGRG